MMKDLLKRFAGLKQRGVHMDSGMAVITGTRTHASIRSCSLRHMAWICVDKNAFVHTDEV